MLRGLFVIYAMWFGHGQRSLKAFWWFQVRTLLLLFVVRLSSYPSACQRGRTVENGMYQSSQSLISSITVHRINYNFTTNNPYNPIRLSMRLSCLRRPPRKLAITEVELLEAVIYAYIPMFGYIFCTVHAYYIEREAAGSTNTRLGFCLPGDLQPRSQNNALHPKRHYFYTKSMIAITITHHFSILKG